MKKNHHSHTDATMAAPQPARILQPVPQHHDNNGQGDHGFPCHDEEVRKLAYKKWQADGCPPGDGFDYWLTAERELGGSK